MAQTAQESPAVSGQLPNTDVYARKWNNFASQENNQGSLEKGL
jgi:hypothetical protein